MSKEALFYRHIWLAKQENRAYSQWAIRRRISITGISILDELNRSGQGSEPGVLAESLLVPRQTMTGLLDQLERRGLIRRTQDERDRRRTKVLLTLAGLELLTSVENDLRPHEAAAVDSISEEDMNTFNRVYETLVTKLAEGLATEKSNAC